MDERKDVPARGAGKYQAAGAPRRLGWIIAASVLLVALLGLAGFTCYGLLLNDKAFPGVAMGQVDLSWMDRSEARQALERAYGGSMIDATVDVQVGEQSFSIPVHDAGLAFDVPGSVERAFQYGRQGDLLTRAVQFWLGLFQPTRLELATELDPALLRDRVAEIASAVEQPLLPSSFRYADGTIALDKGQPGFVLDQNSLTALLETKLRTADFSPAEGTLTQSQPQPLDAAHIIRSVNTPGSETRLDLTSDPYGETILPGTPGIAVDEAALARALLSDNRMETVPCRVTQPKYTVSEYQALLFRDILGEYTTDFNPGNVGRTTNVLLATDFCNGVILMPGDVFSYNDTVGPRTYERGFQDATIYVGDSAEDGVGGGICQVSSTIYAAALRADLKIVERSCHSRYVSYVNNGEDATVSWGHLDFRFENDTEYPLKLVTSHTNNTLTVKLYGTKTQNKTVEIDTRTLSYTPFEVQYVLDESLTPGTESVKSNGYPGYQTESYRVVYIDGAEVSRTFENKSTYRKYDKIILYNPLPASSQQPVTSDPGPSDPGTADPGATDPNWFDPNWVPPGIADPNQTLPGQEEENQTPLPGGQVYLPIDPNGGILP